jgi:hypothetical protein
MKNRRSFLYSVVAGVVALSVVVGSALADELFGTITSADAATKTLKVIPKDQDKEIEVKVTDSTEYVGKKGATPVDFEKITKNIEKAKAKGGKGIMVKIEHEKNVASKITPTPAKKKVDN